MYPRTVRPVVLDADPAPLFTRIRTAQAEILQNAWHALCLHFVIRCKSYDAATHEQAVTLQQHQYAASGHMCCAVRVIKVMHWSAGLKACTKQGDSRHMHSLL